MKKAVISNRFLILCYLSYKFTIKFETYNLNSKLLIHFLITSKMLNFKIYTFLYIYSTTICIFPTVASCIYTTTIMSQNQPFVTKIILAHVYKYYLCNYKLLNFFCRNFSSTFIYILYVFHIACIFSVPN